MQCSSEALWGEASKTDFPPGAKTNKNSIPSGVYSHSREVPAHPPVASAAWPEGGRRLSMHSMATAWQA